MDDKLIRRENLRVAEVADRISRLVAQQVERAIDTVGKDERVAAAVRIANAVLDALEAVASDKVEVERPLAPGEVLSAVGTWRPDSTVRFAERPLIPLLDTTLLTNAPGEPRVGSQILTEIESADSIDLVMAFIRKSGVRPLLPALRQHCAQGKRLRVLTTTYTGSTEEQAIELLIELGAEVRVSYDVSTTRLHAKSWLFHRQTSFSTAYVGSSNLTHSAQIAGMEWNVRVSAARNQDVVDKIGAVFESYWQSVDFVGYDRETFRHAVARTQRPEDSDTEVISPLYVRLEPFQERLLELIELSRAQGQHRNLLVSATGTGKTVMAAMDYARLRTTLPRARLLFVAHREEILRQSRLTFRQVLADHAFGELWVGGQRPTVFDHVFASVQSLAATDLNRLDPTHFDVIIVDEFHHAAAPSYAVIMDDLTPRELLGLTATPERADRLDVLRWFGGRIAAEMRLWDAIEQHRLSPFAYYGIHDGIDLTEIPWQRGRGYDIEALADVYLGNEAWARFVYDQLRAHVDDVNSIRCLGFCVSVAHARFMAAQFQAFGLNAVAVWDQTSHADRQASLRDLAAGRIQVVFSVDLFNEGVDVPVVDTVLMLRPTESATLFIQQLGRGLRLALGKSLCTVLDFVGQHRREFRFDQRYRALLGGTRRDVEQAVEQGFPFLPAGCHMELDRVAREVILQNLKSAVPSDKRSKIRELRDLSQQQRSITLADYLQATGLDVADIYSGNSSWSTLREEAGLQVAPAGPEEPKIRRSIGRLLHIDDRQRIDGYRELLANDTAPSVEGLGSTARRLARMLTASLTDQVITKQESLQSAIDLVWLHPQVRTELQELFAVITDAPDHMQHAALPHVPLQVHSQYTRIEILAAMGEGAHAKTPPWREGVYEAKAAGADLLAFTLDKTSGEFSPTTRYRDYAISPSLIHWESQSGTPEDSPTGRRYRTHAQIGRSILLFARRQQNDRAFWFLGPATYVSHEGERPMAITWRLDTPLSGDLFATFAAAVA